jgi:hypothetical protein
VHTYDAQLKVTRDPRAPGHVMARRSMRPLIFGLADTISSSFKEQCRRPVNAVIGIVSKADDLEKGGK